MASSPSLNPDLRGFKHMSHRLGNWEILFGFFPALLCVFSAKILVAFISFWIRRSQAMAVLGKWRRRIKPRAISTGSQSREMAPNSNISNPQTACRVIPNTWPPLLLFNFLPIEDGCTVTGLRRWRFWGSGEEESSHEPLAQVRNQEKWLQIQTSQIHKLRVVVCFTKLIPAHRPQFRLDLK
ncbi:hypothetical protein L1987_08718 [Smallanthus sonchifolius]|uniref:Uncharacterized protein n=1 Tax=Smallanthus sonchifolius TaxID=185202 RepID=A0ACB9JN80_9ASTR|nr:hypothetical protein L1987_08718 [Smallanthus sonchifolius]